MPGRFDDSLTIDKDGCLTPSGPLELAAGETVVRLDAWVFQQGGACVAVQRVFPDRSLEPAGSGRWTANPNPKEDHTGAMFVPGAATAMALMVSRMAAGQTTTFQWTDHVTLV